MTRNREVMTTERLNRYIDEAAKAAGYREGFGVQGCDLSLCYWWVAYTRQSTKEQAENDRLVAYLVTCAKLAKESGVTVPREYVIYDANSSENFRRPGMIHLRGELVAGRRITGVILPSQGRLSMDVHHQLTFEKECQHYGVSILYGDAPSGSDWASETTRLIQARANALRVNCNRENALEGNISRVRMGKVPAGRAPYGYRYRAKKIFEERTGKPRVLAAWWEINEVGPDGELLLGTPGWVVDQVFAWLADENRTAYWVAAKLSELDVAPPYGSAWTPQMVIEIVRRRCYTGKGEYNANTRVPNLDKPLGDLTLGVKRTLVRPKPDEERLAFEVPQLTSEERWKMANDHLTERGRGRGKQGKAIDALLRGRLFCPNCDKPMSVLRDKRGHVYYYCRAHYCRWLKDPCLYNRFVPRTWDNEIWDEICAMLQDDAWVEQQAVEFRQDEGAEKQIRLQKFNIRKAEERIRRVEEGFDTGFYTVKEAKGRKAGHESAIEKAKQEITRLEALVRAQGFSHYDVDALRQELEALRERNLQEASFEEKADLVAMLGIKVYPSENLNSRRIACRLNLGRIAGEGEQSDFAKVVFGEPNRMRTNRKTDCRV